MHLTAKPDLSKFAGIPFVDGGRSFDGCDCWGLTMLVFKEFGIEVPDYKIACDEVSRIDAEIGTQRVNWERCSPPYPTPCLVVMRFNTVTMCNHVGVYIGYGEFIHTARKTNSHISQIDNAAWARRIEGFYVPKNT